MSAKTLSVESVSEGVLKYYDDFREAVVKAIGSVLLKGGGGGCYLFSKPDWIVDSLLD